MRTENSILSILEGLWRDEHNQWIAETGFPHVKEAIEDYWARVSSQNL